MHSLMRSASVLPGCTLPVGGPGASRRLPFSPVAGAAPAEVALYKTPQAIRGILPPCFALPLVSAPSFKEPGCAAGPINNPMRPSTVLLRLSLRFQLSVMGGQRHAGKEAAHCDHSVEPVCTRLLGGLHLDALGLFVSFGRLRHLDGQHALLEPGIHVISGYVKG